MMIKVNAVSLNHTSYYNFKDKDKPYIKEVHSVYAYNPEVCTHLCELTPSYELRYLYTYIVLNGDVSEEKREELDTRYCYEDNEDTYMWCFRIQKLSNIKECGEHEDMEAACEYLRGNCPF